MKFRLGFVTNSSSSSFILHMNSLSQKDKNELLKRIRSPYKYTEKFISWMDMYFPMYTKENPQLISSYIKGENGGYIPNPIWETLPETLWSFRERICIEDSTFWEVMMTDENTIYFYVSMDNFNFLSYLQFSMEEILHVHFLNDEKDNEKKELSMEEIIYNEDKSNEFLRKFISHKDLLPYGEFPIGNPKKIKIKFPMEKEEGR